MKITKVPNGDYYLQKERTTQGNTFEFPVRATEHSTGRVSMMISNPVFTSKELVGKKLRFKVEIVEAKK